MWDYSAQVLQRGRHRPPSHRYRFVPPSPPPFSFLTDIRMVEDGHVRLFRQYESTNEVNLVSSFRGITDFIPSTIQDPGLVIEWQQGRGHILMGGSVKYIRVWDAPREIAIQVSPPFLSSQY